MIALKAPLKPHPGYLPRDMQAWARNGLPPGIVEVKRGPPIDNSSKNRNLLTTTPQQESPAHAVAAEPASPHRRKLAQVVSLNWAFPADTSTCTKSTDVQRATLLPAPTTAVCGAVVDLVGSAAAGNAIDGFRAFPPVPTLPGGRPTFTFRAAPASATTRSAKRRTPTVRRGVTTRKC